MVGPGVTFLIARFMAPARLVRMDSMIATWSPEPVVVAGLWLLLPRAPVSLRQLPKSSTRTWLRDVTHLEARLTSDLSWGLCSWFDPGEANVAVSPRRAHVGVAGPEVVTCWAPEPQELVEEDEEDCSTTTEGWLVVSARSDAASDLDKPSLLLSGDEFTSLIRSLVSFLFFRRVPITELNLGFSKRLKAAGGDGSVGSGLFGCSRGRRFLAIGLPFCDWTVLLLATACGWLLAMAGLATTILKGELNTTLG